MPKLLFSERTDSNGNRVLNFLIFSLDSHEFLVETYLRNGDDIAESQTQIATFLSDACTDDKDALLKAVKIMLSIEMLPPLKLIDTPS